MKSYFEQFHGDEDENTFCYKECQNVCYCEMYAYSHTADYERDLYLAKIDNEL